MRNIAKGIRHFLEELIAPSPDEESALSADDLARIQQAAFLSGIIRDETALSSALHQLLSGSRKSGSE